METEGKKRALLVVAGGRGVPDFQALFCVLPHLVVILTSEEGWNEEFRFRDAVTGLPEYEDLLPTEHVPSYDMKATKEKCMQICKLYPPERWEWTFSIGSCPKIMGIGAYEAAKELDRPCIYMDAQHKEVVSLVRSFSPIPPNIFYLGVDDYLKIYGREVDETRLDKKAYRDQAENWGHIARIIACSPVGSLFTQEANETLKNIQLPSFSPELLQLVENLENVRAVTIHERRNRIAFAFTSKDFAKFLGTGSWLEIYVWNEVKKRNFANDHQWGYPIKESASSIVTSRGKAPNELDGLFMHDAQLILVECKTGKGTFKGPNHYLDILNDKADMLGRSYVTKIFVTNQNKKQDSYADFERRAEARQIVVFTAEDLPDIGQLIEKEAKNPRYKRR